MMNGDCECGECESCIAALEHIKERNKELFGGKKVETTKSEDNRRQVSIMHGGV